MEKMVFASEQTKGLIMEREGQYLGVRRFFGMKGIWDTDAHPETLGTFFLDTDVGRSEGHKLKVTKFKVCKTGYQSRMEDQTGTFAVETVVTMEEETGIFSRQDFLENLDTVPHTVYACLARYPLHGDDFEVYAQSSGWCAENEGEWRGLSAGNLELTNSGGRSTDTANPFLCIRQRSTGAAAAIHVLPIGDWIIKVRRQAGSRTTFAVIEAGLSNQGLRLTIQPGERLTLPELLLQGFEGEPSNAAPLLHRYILNRWPGKEMTDFIYNTWFLDFDTVEPERLKRQVGIAAELGCKYYVVDAGWFGTGDNWWEQVGDWQERLNGAFCGNLKEFSDYVREQGMEFGIWMEPERASTGSGVYRENPDWFRSCDAIQYDLMNPEVEEYLLNQIIDVIQRYDVRWIKIDYNSNFFRDLGGENYYRYCLASDRLMKRAREACPQTIFEGCASGGLRTDIRQVMEKSANHFISDSVHPTEVLRMRQNAALRMLPQYFTTWSVLEEVPFPISSNRDRNRHARRKLFASADAEWIKVLDVSTDYSAVTTFAGCPGISGDLETLSADTKSRIKEWVEFYQENRRFLEKCVCHLITAPGKIDDINGWVVMQYEHIGGEGSMLYAWRLNDDVSAFACYPKNIEKDRVYRVETLDREAEERTGESLQVEGLEIRCEEYFGATVVKLKKVV